MDTGHSFADLVQAYFDCRRNKRNTASALRFEQNLEANLATLHEELTDGSYRPGRSVCFVITHPKPREVWAAEFRDRVVHHLLYNRIAPRFLNRFIADSCACIPGKGTLYAAKRLDAKVRSITENWAHPAYYLKADLANFFVSIDKRALWLRMSPLLIEPWWRQLAALVLFHDPRLNVDIRGGSSSLKLVPPHKRLMNAPDYHGLPIGNLSSQFFANILLDGLDQHVKHRVRAKHYIRYVDDFVILSRSTQFLNTALQSVNHYLPSLGLALNPRKTIIQPIARGIDFVGHVIKPWRREIRRRTVRTALNKIHAAPASELFESVNSYLGLLGQAKSHRDRALVANAARKRGHSVNGAITKTYRSSRPTD